MTRGDPTDSWLRQEIHTLGSRWSAWYRKFCYIGVRAWFSVRCDTRLMIRDVWDQADCVFARLDPHMKNIVSERGVAELTNNAALEGYE